MIIRLIRWANAPAHGRLRWALIAFICLVILGFSGSAVVLLTSRYDPLDRSFFLWRQGNPAKRQELTTVRRNACPGAPFILPADGFIGLLYGDPRGPYSRARPHQGIDIFSNSDPGVTPVYAAHDGYVTRETGWRSSLIIRLPSDPLREGRQIWLYYTHMADSRGNDFIEEFIPPGTHELFVRQGTLLGYTGDFNGKAVNGIWVHLHFSIVMDDGKGNYRNELEFRNTLDPSPYLGLPLHHACAPAEYADMVCSADPCE